MESIQEATSWGRLILEFIIVAAMTIGVIWVFVNRKQSGSGGRARALGVRTLQHLALVFVAPTVFVLALERAIDAQATTAILGALVGYIFSSLNQREKSTVDDATNR